MIELIRHIENLLLDNDCVVIPGFGGFIVHYMPATWNEAEEMFYPPVRTIGFNAQLKMNDGVLVQSYMELYGTDFSDATRILQKDIEQLTKTLHKEGKIDLANIGEISISVQGSYVFLPYEEILSPAFYGMDCFDIKDLKSLGTSQMPSRVSTEPPVPKKNYEIKISRVLVRNAVAAVAAILLFFYMSDPIENTYVEKHNYAQLLPTDLLFEKQSLLTTPVGSRDEKMELFLKTTGEESEKLIADAKSDDDPALQDTTQRSIAVKEVKVSRQQSKAAVRYHIIVGSVTFRDDAEATVANLKSVYPDASMIVGDGKIRISLASHSTREDADKQLIELRKNNTYKDAWLLIR